MHPCNNFINNDHVCAEKSEPAGLMLTPFTLSSKKQPVYRLFFCFLVLPLSLVFQHSTPILASKISQTPLTVLSLIFPSSDIALSRQWGVVWRRCFKTFILCLCHLAIQRTPIPGFSLSLTWYEAPPSSQRGTPSLRSREALHPLDSILAAHCKFGFTRWSGSGNAPADKIIL